jgi:hypothetical protein
MKIKFFQIVLATILISFLSYNIVHACSILPPTIIVKCSNFETSISTYISRSENETSEEYQKRVVAVTIENLYAVSPNCEEDLSPVLEAFEKEISIWLNQKNKRILLDWNLMLELYSTERDDEIQKNSKNLFSCDYEESQRVGNWLIINQTGRSYCFTFTTFSGSCPSVFISLSSFLFYLIMNLSFTTMPYFMGLLIIISLVVYLWWMILRKYSTLAFWKLIIISIVILFAEIFLVFPLFGFFGQIIGWFLFFGLIVLWYIQIKYKTNITSQNGN